MPALTETALAVVRQFLLFSALLTPLEILWPARPGQSRLRRGVGTDLAWFAVNPFLINLGAAALFAAIGAAATHLVPDAARARLGAQPRALQLVEILVIGEVLSYWIHRASHRFGWLWRLHAVHHSAESMDWLVAHRQHPVEAVLLLGAANLPAIVLGYPTDTLLWFIVAQKVYTAFLHANVRIGYGRLGVLLASPRFHHGHHDADAGPRAGNYASTLPVLDLLWGTYRSAPASRFPARYGIDEPIAASFLGQLVHPLRKRRGPAEARTAR